MNIESLNLPAHIKNFKPCISEGPAIDAILNETYYVLSPVDRNV